MHSSVHYLDICNTNIEVLLELNPIFFSILKLNSEDEDVVDEIICVFKGTIFKLNYSSEGSLVDTRQMDAVLPLLLQLLDERDGAARAVIALIAEYCAMYVICSSGVFMMALRFPKVYGSHIWLV